LGKKPIYGIKSMLELIAVSVTKQKVGNLSMLRAFKTFLGDVSNIDKLKLAFEKDAQGNWVIQKSGGKRKCSKTLKFELSFSFNSIVFIQCILMAPSSSWNLQTSTTI
jgi:hypothetical protein